MKSETKSNWECVSRSLQNQKPLRLGPYAAHQFYETPQKMLTLLSCYKFAAKLIGKGKRVLEFGCKEGWGTYLLAKECGFAKGIDVDKEAIQWAQKNFQKEGLDFEQEEVFLDAQKEKAVQWDAILCIEPLLQESRIRLFLEQFSPRILPEGIILISTSAKGSRAKAEMSCYFTNIFCFSIQEEWMRAGESSSADRLLIIGCKRYPTKRNLSNRGCPDPS
jgi:2-polyprenyl-3-methyl-5-hydroxy-6-metoxy-1,4-benzoquinol methylase